MADRITLTALMPRFHAVFAPNFKHRVLVVPRRLRGRVDSDRPRAPMSWMQRLKRVFAIAIETCAECGGKLRVIACIEEPQLIRKLPGHVRQRDALRGIKTRALPDGAGLVAGLI